MYQSPFPHAGYTSPPRGSSLGAMCHSALQCTPGSCEPPRASSAHTPYSCAVPAQQPRREAIKPGTVVHLTAKGKRNGALGNGETGTVIRVDGPAHIAPYKVRSERGAEGWYAADELVPVSAAPSPHVGQAALATPGRISYTVTARRGESVGLTCRLIEGKVVIATVDPSSPAHHAGLTPGCILQALGGIPVRKLSDVQHALTHLRGPQLERMVLNVDVERTGTSANPTLEDLVQERMNVIASLHRRSLSPDRLDKERARQPPPSKPSYYSPPGARMLATESPTARPPSVAGSAVPSAAGSDHASLPPGASSYSAKPEHSPPRPSRSPSHSTASSGGKPVHSPARPSRSPSNVSNVSNVNGTPDRAPSVTAPSVGSVKPTHSPSRPPSHNSGTAPPSRAASVASAASAGAHVPPLQQLNIDQHNALRSQHGAPALVYDPELAKHAQAQADQCLRDGRLGHGNNDGEGQNAFWAGGSALPDEQAVNNAVSGWYGEIADFKRIGGGVPALGAAGHFTQVVWKDSIKVGLGIAKSANEVFVVANYYPPGNLATAEEVAKNVQA